MSDLAAQAGLVLRNIGLTGQLRARLAELQASRLRIVAAADDQRRRIERDIDAGAQQQLLAITAKLALAESVAGQRRGAGAGAGRRGEGRDQRRAEDAARARPRHLPAAARRPGPRRRGDHPGQQGAGARGGGCRRARPLPGGDRNGHLLLLCGGAPERRQACAGVGGAGQPSREPRTGRCSRSPTTAPASTRPPRPPGRGCGTSVTGWQRSVVPASLTPVPAGAPPSPDGSMSRTRGPGPAVRCHSPTARVESRSYRSAHADPRMSTEWRTSFRQQLALPAGQVPSVARKSSTAARITARFWRQHDDGDADSGGDAASPEDRRDANKLVGPGVATLSQARTGCSVVAFAGKTGTRPAPDSAIWVLLICRRMLCPSRWVIPGLAGG